MYHVGRPGEDGFAERFLMAWGVDGHNSHTNICSSGARFGQTLWGGFDRPSPDYAHAKVILLLSSHLETGHYFNPHAQRIMEGKLDGAQLIVVDPRMSNTASHAEPLDRPVARQRGRDPAVDRVVPAPHAADRCRLPRRWFNWDVYLEDVHPDAPRDFATFLELLTEDYAQYTFEFAAAEAQIPVERIEEMARLVAQCEGRLSAHVWRSAAAGNYGGWAVSRACGSSTR